jgi:hypothetical protein
MKEGANVTVESSNRNERSVQCCRFSCCIGGLVAGQASVARDQGEKKELPDL